jgi:class 3 adenylate cyclase
MRKGQLHVTFRIAIVGAIFGIVLVMSLLTCLIIYTRGEADAKVNAMLLFAENSRKVQERLDKRLGALTRIASLGAAVPALETRVAGSGLDHPAISFFFGVIETEPSVYASYSGWANGDFLMLINTSGNRQILEANQAPADCRYIVRAISGQGETRAQRWSYLDASRRVLSERTEPQPAYDPRRRDWYRLAADDRRTHLGKAYVFNSLREPGITASRSFGGGTGGGSIDSVAGSGNARATNDASSLRDTSDSISPRDGAFTGAGSDTTLGDTSSTGVFGVDMTLSDIKSFLNEAAASEREGILLLEDGRRLLAASNRAEDWLPANVAALGDVGNLSVVAAGQEWKAPNGETWLRQRSDWTWGADTRLALVIMAPLSEFTNFFDTIWYTLLLLALMVLVVVTPIALLLSAELSRPLAIIAQDAEKVSAMDFGDRFDYQSWIVEIDRLGSGYAKMKDALKANRALIEAQRDSFARFVPEKMLALFDKSSVTDVKPRDCKPLELTVMFSDIRSYTAISEGLSCGGVFNLLNAYFAMTNPIIDANGGIIDKYIGDAILSVFPNTPDGALRSVIAINRELQAFNEARRKNGESDILTGTGIHFGNVDLGTVGNGTRLQATVIGDAVNLASRLESATKVFSVRVLMSEAALARLENPGEFHLRRIDTVRVKGKEQPIDIYEVFDLDEPAVLEKKLQSAATFAEALQCYKAGDFSRSLDLFASCAEACPSDTVVMAYLKRCSTLIRIPPGNDWAGVSTL